MKPCIKMYTGPVSADYPPRHQERLLTDLRQENEADAVCSHGLLGSNLFLVEPEEGKLARQSLADCGPTQVEATHGHEANKVRSKGLDTSVNEHSQGGM